MKNTLPLPVCVLDDFQTWILAVHPEEKEEIEGVPNALLQGLYPEIWKFGPSMAKIRAVDRAVTRINNTYGREFLEQFLKPYANLAVSMAAQLRGTMSRVNPELAESQQKKVAELSKRIKLKNRWSDESSTTRDALWFFFSAYTIAQFPEVQKYMEYKDLMAPLTEWEFSIKPVHLNYRHRLQMLELIGEFG